MSRRRDAELRARRRARRTGAIGFLLAAALPVVLWREAVTTIAGGAFSWDAAYLTGWAPWVLIAAGLAFFLPVALSAGGDPDGRWYPRARNAYLGWGASLYVLGFALASQVAQILGGTAGP